MSGELIGYISLGSNLGNKAGHVLEASRLLEGPGLRVTRSSSLWITEPVDGAAPGQGMVLYAGDTVLGGARISGAER